MYRLSLIIFSLFISGCWVDEPVSFPAGEVEGYSPIYSTDPDIDIYFESAQSIVNPGKIYLYNNYLLLSDIGFGIHVFDNSDRSNPERIGFLHIEGNVDISMKGNIIYADHFGGLVTIDISDIQSPVVLDRIFNITEDSTLPPSGHYFECIPTGRENEIVGWKLELLDNPECYR